MSPFHRGFVLQLNTTTALQLSASWLASENIRLMREKNGEFYIKTKSVSLQQEIEGAILLSEVKPTMERMN
jgi:hypothetical protein